jgi:glycyl-tRNA synthetase alpha subunit
MEWKDLIIDGFGRLPAELEEILKGLKAAEVNWQPAAGANSIGWTVWHLSRLEDAQIADLAGWEQVYLKEKWYLKFKRSADPKDTGYGHSPEDVAAFKSPDTKVLMGYLRASTNSSQEYLKSISSSALDRVLNEPWFSPLPTVGVRLVSILVDCCGHAGEASYLRGLLKSRPAK